MSTWEKQLPRTNGKLPGGEDLVRTEPSGLCEAGIAFLGAYPAATRVAALDVAGVRLNLPTEVEHESFAPESASGREFEAHYLAPLALTRRDVLVTDMVPYYLANTSGSGKGGRSMADNVRRWNETNFPTNIEARPSPTAFVDYARNMAGNLDRLEEIFCQRRPRLLLTLGLEAAAFVRGISFQRARGSKGKLLYGQRAQVRFAGVELEVVHLVHPHMFIKKIAKWTSIHNAWVADSGRVLLDGVRSAGGGKTQPPWTV